MSTITKDLGVVTAYGYAVTKGYEGTEEEFAELMASYATVAAQAAQSAETAEEAAEAAAQAVLDANAAKTAAQAAQSAAESASTTAQGAATSASNSASSATSSASTASTAATTATEKATEAAASATAAAGSATAAETAQEAAEDAQAAAEAAVSSLADFAPTVENTASGDIASFTDGADDYPVKDLVAHIDPVQSGSGDPSPDNVRPITGWTGANVVVSPTQNAEDGTTYAVTFPTEAGTVYGGTLDVTTGVLTVDRKLYTFTGDEQFGLVTSTHNYFRWYSTDFINTIPDWKIPNEIKLSSYPSTIKGYWDAGADTNKSAWTVFSAAGVCFRNDDYSTALEFAASLVGQGMLYELAEPVTYQLTPTEVKTLLGANNIFADTGSVDVEYCADTKKYIDNAIAAAVASLS